MIAPATTTPAIPPAVNASDFEYEGAVERNKKKKKGREGEGEGQEERLAMCRPTSVRLCDF